MSIIYFVSESTEKLH